MNAARREAGLGAQREPQNGGAPKRPSLAVP
jgi:hypothetical protein